MVRIIPAIMPDSLTHLTEMVAKVKGIVREVQIDVMDGVFVPEKTWPYIEGGPQEFKTKITDDTGLPFWEEIDYEIDLMVSEPLSSIDDWALIGARRIIVHIESTQDIREIITTLEDRHLHEDTQFHPVEFGLSVGVDTPNEMLEPYIHDVDFVQCMGIKKIGFQGQPFDERVLEKITDLKERHPHLILSVDGGVNFDSAPRLIGAGADRLVSGSTVFTSDNMREVVRKLKQQQ